MALRMNVYRTLTDKVLFSLRNLASSLYRCHLSLVVVVVIKEIQIVLAYLEPTAPLCLPFGYG